MKNFIEDYLPIIAIAGGVIGFIVGVGVFVWTYFTVL